MTNSQFSLINFLTRGNIGVSVRRGLGRHQVQFWKLNVLSRKLLLLANSGVYRNGTLIFNSNNYFPSSHSPQKVPLNEIYSI